MEGTDKSVTTVKCTCRYLQRMADVVVFEMPDGRFGYYFQGKRKPRRRRG